jgi:hypothetical protein
MTLREELFELLPLVYRQRDAEPRSDHALHRLLEVLGSAGDVVAADLGQLYDDWFIETCADWVVPYLGDLLGVRLLHPLGPGAGRSRAFVANTLEHRRRKGTVAALEQLGTDVTGWPTAAEEYFTRLSTTQHLAHPRLAAVQVPDLRDPGALELHAGPFGSAAHTPEARRPPVGRFAIGTLGLHVWRLPPQRVVRASARPVTDPPDGRYLVDPLGLTVPLANPGRTEQDATTLAGEEHVPGLLRRRALYDELEALRSGALPEPRWFGENPVVEVYVDLGSGLVPVPVASLTAADLGDPPQPRGVGWPRPAAPLIVALDPVLGRLAFREGLLPTAVEVTSTYLAPGRVGAGPYDRTTPATSDLLDRATWFRAVGARATPVPGAVHTTVAAALADWALEPPGTVGVIAVLDSRSYAEDLDVGVPGGSELLLAAVTWPAAEDAAPAAELSLSGASLSDRRPHLRGTLTVTGTPGGQDAPPGHLCVDGLLVEGDVRVDPGDLGRLSLSHVTVVPGRGRLQVAGGGTVDTDNGRLDVVVLRSILGGIVVPDPGPDLSVETSVVDGAGGVAVQAPAVGVSLTRVTALGAVSCAWLGADDSVLAGEVEVERSQRGCLRFSSVEPAAVSPRRYRCQPDLALQGVTEPGRAAAIRLRLAPVFRSTTFGEPGYARLDDRCDPALLTGASNGAAMGVHAELEEPQRMSNLAAVLEEYLPLGIQAGIVPET